jgi:catechol 2,3-dioxygenase-like lactoylglutathione lyase family enzyme
MPDLAAPSIIIAMDVVDLARSCGFYHDALGYTVEAVERAGLIFESRRLRSPLLPAVALHLREQFGIRVGGTQPGTVLRLSAHVDDLGSWADRLLAAGVRWVIKPDVTIPAGTLRFADPNGYEWELFRTPAPLVVPPPV